MCLFIWELFGNKWYSRGMYDKNVREFEHHRKPLCIPDASIKNSNNKNNESFIDTILV